MSERLLIRFLEPEDADELAEFYLRNREHLAATSPDRPERFFTKDYQHEELVRHTAERRSDKRYVFGVWLDGLLIGRIALNEVVRAIFQNAFIGYMIDKDHLNRGLMTLAVKEVLRRAFTDLQLHRVEATILPDNLASQRVVEKCGFTRLGLAERYLLINGAWRDHYVYYLLAENFDTEG
jgi:ribosomal-protein-alanine N-acetyltransferase